MIQLTQVQMLFNTHTKYTHLCRNKQKHQRHCDKWLLMARHFRNTSLIIRGKMTNYRASQLLPCTYYLLEVDSCSWLSHTNPISTVVCFTTLCDNVLIPRNDAWFGRTYKTRSSSISKISHNFPYEHLTVENSLELHFWTKWSSSFTQ